MDRRRRRTRRVAIDFVKEGYESKNISVSISESTRIPPIDVTMKKTAAAVDATAAIKGKLTEAAAHVSAKRFAEARAIYTDLSTRYPDVAQFDPLIARTYHAEGNRAKAIEHLRAGLAKDPANVEVKLLLGNTLIENGQTEEGQKMLTSVDDSKVTDPAVYLNVGIAMINQGRHADAVTWFERALARFPEHPDAYYYRGIARVSLGKPAEAMADLEKFVAMAPPDAPELPTAKKILDGLK